MTPVLPKHAGWWFGPAAVLILWSVLLRLDVAGLPAAALAAPYKQGAELLKTDLMGVFAHPDDETGMAATLAAYALGRTSVVAAVYCTRGEGGGNMVGTQSGAALGQLREAELRDCLTTLGVRYCYFLDRLDWAYTESLAATLRKWNHDQTLENLVRLVRQLRPEVMVTMNPAPTPGQHGHHQAAGVLATEAFTAAANPAIFPLQLRQEGLRVWQTRKLYYGGGNTGIVATIIVTNALPSGLTPAQVAARALVNHRSQAFGNFSSSPWLSRPQKFTLVESYVPATADETDLLQGLPAVQMAKVVFPHLRPAGPQLEFVPRPAIERYRHWAAGQGVEHVSAQLGADLPVVAGEVNPVTLRLFNEGTSLIRGVVTIEVSDGWELEPVSLKVEAPSGSTNEIKLRVTPSPTARGDGEIRAKLNVAEAATRATARLHPVPRAKVPRLRTPPALDGSDRGWEVAPVFIISSTNTWQGKPDGDNDCSAVFRLAHDGETLFVEIDVRDDAVISNIAPDDIKGHWRSDSVEICLDPVGGAEDTMGSFKLGVFPFDTTGAVRAARDADANPGLVEETAPHTRLKSVHTAEGYRIQAAIPFNELGISKAGRKSLGFNVLIYDGDKRGAAPGENINESRIAWAPRSGVMGRPEDWGRIDLE